MGLLENVPKIKDVRDAARGFGPDVADAAGKAAARGFGSDVADAASNAVAFAGNAVAVAGKALETPARVRTVRAFSSFGGE